MRAAFLLCLCSPLVCGIGILVSPVPRPGSGGVLLPPFSNARSIANQGCGGSANSDIGVTIPTQAFVQGSQLNVTWQLDLPLPAVMNDTGVRIAIHYGGDDGFERNPLAGGLEGGPPYTTVSAGPDNATARVSVSLSVILPSKACDYCTLQWVWASRSEDGSYIGCADIAVNAVGTLPDYSQLPSQDGNVLPDVAGLGLDNEKCSWELVDLLVLLGVTFDSAQAEFLKERERKEIVDMGCSVEWHLLRSHGMVQCLVGVLAGIVLLQLARDSFLASSSDSEGAEAKRDRAAAYQLERGHILAIAAVPAVWLAVFIVQLLQILFCYNHPSAWISIAYCLIAACFVLNVVWCRRLIRLYLQSADAAEEAPSVIKRRVGMLLLRIGFSHAAMLPLFIGAVAAQQWGQSSQCGAAGVLRSLEYLTAHLRDAPGLDDYDDNETVTTVLICVLPTLCCLVFVLLWFKRAGGQFRRTRSKADSTSTGDVAFEDVGPPPVPPPGVPPPGMPLDHPSRDNVGEW